jgi:hypothetical protein
MLRRILPLLLLLAGCGDTAPEPAAVDPLEEELASARTGDGADPLLMSVVHGPLMTDPQLSTRANANSVRPPSQPYGAPLPDPTIGTRPDPGTPPPPAPAPTACTDCRAATQALTLAALASAQRDPRLARCAGQLRYSARWAIRLPADLTLPADARVMEAAGADSCDLRAVSYVAPRPLGRVIDDAHARASAAGYRITHQSDGARHLLRGDRSNGSTFLLVAIARTDATSDVTLLVNNGR